MIIYLVIQEIDDGYEILKGFKLESQAIKYVKDNFKEYSIMVSYDNEVKFRYHKPGDKLPYYDEIVIQEVDIEC